MSSSTIKIDPDAFYTEGEIVIGLDISSGTLSKAKKSSQLRYRKIGKRTFYLGRWILDWLEQDIRSSQEETSRG
jgi:hypothetical protein